MLTDERKELFHHYFQKNSDYYTRQIELYEENGKCSFSVAAFFLGVIWMAYRKMYVTVLIIIGILIAEGIIEEALLDFGIISYKTYEIIDKLFLLIWSFVIGAISNRLYIKQSIRKVNKILETNDDAEIINNEISRKGGINWLAPLGLSLLIILLLIFSL